MAMSSVGVAFCRAPDSFSNITPGYRYAVLEIGVMPAPSRHIATFISPVYTGPLAMLRTCFLLWKEADECCASHNSDKDRKSYSGSGKTNDIRRETHPHYRYGLSHV